MHDNKHSWRAGIVNALMKIFPLLTIALIAVVVGSLFGRVTVNDILRYTPQNHVLAAFAVIGIYGIKSLSVFFPLLVLYVSVGMLFPPLMAIVVNLCGLFVCVSVPYWMGRFAGREWVEKLLAKYPKASQINRIRFQNEWFFSYILRVINLLPGDIVSLFLGAVDTNYKKYMAGSIAGLFPTMAAATFMGDHITEPGSPQFIAALSMTVVISIISFVVYRRVVKRHG